MAERYFTADTHFGHINIIKYCNRPFDSVEEMNERIVENFNKVVQPEDTLIHLGDVSMGKIEDTIEWARKLNGHKILIPGNHDRVWVGETLTRQLKYKELYEDIFQVIPHPTHTFFGEEMVLMSHFPYAGDHTEEDRHQEFRPYNQGRFLLHGHIHDEWKIKEGRMLNVGIDEWDYRPVSVDEIQPYIDKFIEKRESSA